MDEMVQSDDPNQAALAQADQMIADQRKSGRGCHCIRQVICIITVRGSEPKPT
jgi:hypothetical protein